MTHHPIPSIARRCLRFLQVAVIVLAGVTPARAERTAGLPSPLRLEDVVVYARAHRQEIVAARARARAAAQRPAVVSGLEEPMVMPSVDHLPFMLHGVDASLMVEQRFPLSGVLGYKRRAAEADARRLQAVSEVVEQDVALEAVRAFLMLHERRAMARILARQVALAGELAGAAAARYAAGPGNQPEVLRAEVEVARLEGAVKALRAEVSAAEAMLNASLGRAVESVVPPLAGPAVDRLPPGWPEVRARSLRRRSELGAGRSEIARAQAEISAMDAMSRPMGLVRTGPAYTMTDGWGWMLTVGVTVPLWTGRYRAGVREAQAMAQMARADLSAMSRMVEGEAAAARFQVIAARERFLALRDEVLPRARQAIDPSVSAYAAGTIPLVSVLDAAQALWSIEAELLAAEFDLGVAWARLLRAQGGFEPERRR